MLSNIDFGSYFHTKKYEKGLSTGGDKIADWGGSKGGWGGHVPPSLYVKRGPGDLACQQARSRYTGKLFISYERNVTFHIIFVSRRDLARKLVEKFSR